MCVCLCVSCELLLLTNMLVVWGVTPVLSQVLPAKNCIRLVGVRKRLNSALSMIFNLKKKNNNNLPFI